MLFCFTCDWLAGPTGIEPAAYGLRVRRSGLTELRARKVASLKKVSLNNIELAVLLLQLDAVNTNNKASRLVYWLI